MAEETIVTNAELVFRTKFRDQWAAWLTTEAGRTFISALYSHKPKSRTMIHPHQECHRAGEVENFDHMMELIAVGLLQPVTVTEEIPQDYPDDDNNPSSPTQEPKK